MDKVHTVYRTVCIETGQFYVGKHTTTDPNDSYLGSGKRLNNLIKAHPEYTFEKEVLAVLETEEGAYALEHELVQEVLGQALCLNLAEGGSGFTSKRSEALWADPEYKERLSKTITETWEDPERKAGMSERTKEMWEDPAYRERMSSLSAETAKKTWQKPGHREKMSRLAAEQMRKQRSDPAAKALLDAASRKRRLFTDDQARAIRALHAAGVTYTALAKQFGCGRSSISLIINRKTYADVD